MNTFLRLPVRESASRTKYRDTCRAHTCTCLKPTHTCIHTYIHTYVHVPHTCMYVRHSYSDKLLSKNQREKNQLLISCLKFPSSSSLADGECNAVLASHSLSAPCPPPCSQSFSPPLLSVHTCTHTLRCETPLPPPPPHPLAPPPPPPHHLLSHPDQAGG